VARRELEDARHAEREARGDVERLAGELADLERDGEEEPRVPGLRAARDALRRAGIDAAPLYELLVPRAGADEAQLAALEAALGDSVLGALLVAETDTEAARALALAHEGVRLVSRVDADATLPGWVQHLLEGAPRGLGLSAHAALATMLVQPSSLGAVEAPDALLATELRGQVRRSLGGVPRLLGAAARRRARARRVDEAAARLGAARSTLSRAEVRAAVTARRVHALGEGQAALLDLRGRALLELASALAVAARGAQIERERALEADDRLERATRERGEASARLEALRARARDAGLEELERRLSGLRAEARTASEQVSEAHRARARSEELAERLRSEQSALEGQLEVLASRLAAEAIGLEDAVRALGLDVEDVERWARVTQRGDQFRSLEAIDEAAREAARQIDLRSAELDGDGSRGLRNLRWAARFGLTRARGASLRILDRKEEPLASVLAELERNLAEQRALVTEETRELMDTLVMGSLARQLQEQVERLTRTVRELNGLLARLEFGATRYQFRVTPRADRKHLVDLVRRVSVLDEESRARFREFVDERLDELRRAEGSEVPELLDYRQWFDYRLVMTSRREGAGTDGGTELTRELRALGSGGEQGVPNYLLVLALAKLAFDAAGARLRPLLFDEAFYGIDAGRRDQLLRFATELGIQLVVASPDQDGVTPAVRAATTLFLVKDEHGDVHLAPYHFWSRRGEAQVSLLEPDEPEAAEAECVLGEASE
jgi:hypothetical protein